MIIELVIILFFGFIISLLFLFNILFANINVQYNPEYSFLTNSWYVKLQKINKVWLVDRTKKYLNFWSEVDKQLEMLKDFYFISSDWKTNVLTLVIWNMEPWATFKIQFDEYTKVVWIIHNSKKIDDASFVWEFNKYLVWNNKVFLDQNWDTTDAVDISPDSSNNFYDIVSSKYS